MRLPTGITRNVLVLGVVSLLTDISSEMLYPIVPLFVTTVLGASPAIVGVMEGLAESTASLLKIWSGYLSDRMGVRKPLVFGGYGLSALTRPLLAVAYTWPVVLIARVLDRVGKGLRGAPRDALIVDSVDPVYRGRAFGLHRSMDQTGAIIGPLLGAALLSWFDGNFRLAFMAAFLPSLASTLAVAFAQERKAEHVRAPVRFSWSAVTPEFRRFLLIVTVFSIGNSADAFLILRAHQLGVPTEQTLLLFALFNTVYVVSAFPAGVLSDRIGRLSLFQGGLGVFALVYAGFALVRDVAWLPLLFGIYGLYMGLTDGISRAIVSDVSQPEQRATALGLHAAVVGLAAFPASALAGLMWSKVGPGAPFAFGSAMAAAAVLLTSVSASRRLKTEA